MEDVPQFIRNDLFNIRNIVERSKAQKNFLIS